MTDVYQQLNTTNRCKI